MKILACITEKTIRNLTSQAVYEKGESCYLNGDAINISISNLREEKIGLDITMIKGKVKSQDENKTYTTSVAITEYGGIINMKCDCIAFMNYFPSMGICKHLVAILLKYVKEKDAVIKINGSGEMKKLIASLNSVYRTNRDRKKQMKVEYFYEYLRYEMYNLHSLELKVGEETTYVVKDIKKFLEAMIEQEDIICFGKKFTYDPKLYYLSDNDKKIMDIFVEIYEMNESLKYSGSLGGYNKFIKGKKIFLTDSQIKKVFTLLKGREIGFKVQFGERMTTTIADEEIPLEYSISQNGQELVLKQNGPIPIALTRDKEYVFYDGKIYELSKQQSAIFSAISASYKDSRERYVSFSGEDKEDMFSYVVPSLKKISRDINVDPVISRDIYEADLKISIYLDKENKGISAKVKCSYGDMEINPLSLNNDRSDNGILVRNIQGELEPINFLLSLGFKEKNYKLVLEDDEELIEFLTKHLKELSQTFQVYYSDDFKDVKIHNTPSINSSIRLNEDDLLEFDFSIEGVSKEELKEVFSAINEKKKYYRLKKGGFMPLQSEEFSNIYDMLQHLNIKDSDLQKDRILLSRYNALFINEEIKNKELSIKKHDSFDKLLSDIEKIKNTDFTPSESINKIMREYQKFGFKWLKTLAKCGFGGILADEMGLGKTLQTIAFIESEVDDGDKRPTLIVVPSSLIYNWQDEIERYAPKLKTIIICGDKRERKSRIKTINNYDVVITSYALIRKDIEEYVEFNFKYCILDEAQNIKNPNSLSSKAVKEIKAKNCFAITGTPIENSLTELWSIFDFIMPGYLMNHSRFQQKYEVPIIKAKDKKALDDLNYRIKPFILRRVKKDVIKELPSKIEHKILVDMTKEQKKIYAAYLSQYKQEIESEIMEKGFRNSKLKILSILTRLRQICDDPSTFIDNFKGDSGKLQALDDLLEESISSGHRILLFSQFTTVLNNIGKRLKKNSIEYMYLDGKTKVEERLNLVKEFNKGKGSIFLISLKAGGTGLNLTGADTVIHFDQWWNPAVEEQATDRAHRIGQENIVEVIKVIAKGTIEEKIYNLQQKKKKIISSIMDSEVREEGLISQMSEEEIRELLS